MLRMINVLKEAMKEVENLSPAAQEQIGSELLLHVEKLHRLRAKLDKGIASIARGESRELDIEDVIKHARAEYGKG